MSEMYGFWFDLSGKQGRRLKPFELEEAKRLFHKHADIRTGNVLEDEYPVSARSRQLKPKLEVRDSTGSAWQIPCVRDEDSSRRPP